MNQFQRKFINFFLIGVSCLATFNVSGSPSSEEIVDEVRLLRFENRCMSEEKAQTQFCQKEYEVLMAYIEGESTNQNSNIGHCSSQDGSFERLIQLDSDFQEVKSELACTKEDQKSVKESCGKEFACNMGRSVVTLVDSMAPKFISNKVRDGLSYLLSPEEGSSCLNEDQPDCLSEIYRSFIGSLVATATSFRDLGRATVSAFSSLKSYLFDKSEDLHKAAETTQEEAVSFIDNPGKYLLSKLSKFKNTVDSWIKDTVFCQKWDEDKETKERFCAEPLQGYSCLDCDDGVNAFCAGAGFLLSEGLITVATAGTLTGVGVIAKAGATVGGKLMARGAAALAERVPALSKLSRQSKNTASAARQASLISRAKDRVTTFSRYLKDSRLGRGIAKANEVATFPLRFVDDLSQKTIEKVLSGASRVGTRTILGKSIRVTAKGDLRAIRLAQRNSDTVISTAGTTSKGLLGNKAIRLGNRHRTTHRPEGSRTRRDTEVRDPNSPDRRSQTERDRRDQLEREQGAQRERERSAQAERERLEREKREREDHAKKDDHRDEKSGTTVPPVVSAARTLVGVDLANKSYQSLKEGFSEELIPSQDVIDNQLAGNDQHLDSKKSLEENLEERTGRRFSNSAQAQSFTENMNSIYQNRDRKNEVIRSMMNSRGLSRTQAEKVYESERRFYSDAQKKFLGDQTRNSQLTAEVKNLKRQIKINDLLDKVKGLRREIDSSFKEDRPSPETRERTTERRVKTPEIPDRKISSRLAGDQSVQDIQANRRSELPPLPLSSQFNELEEEGKEPELVSDDENGEVTDKTKGPQELKKEETPLEEDQRQTDATLSTMEFFSLFLTEVEKEGLSFRDLDLNDKALIRPILEKTTVSMELDHLKVAQIGKGEKKFFIFFDEVNQKTVVLDHQGHHLNQIPMDLI